MAELIHNLGIEWKIILAQIVNFAVLLFLLKRFAYGPVIRILSERREKIEDAIERSKSVDARMAEIEDLKEKVLNEARVKSEEIITKAEQSARKVQEDTLAITHQKSEKLMEDTKKKVEAEREKIFQEVKREIAELVTLAVEKSVGDIADEKTQEKLVAEALELVQANK